MVVSKYIDHTICDLSCLNASVAVNFSIAPECPTKDPHALIFTKVQVHPKDLETATVHETPEVVLLILFLYSTSSVEIEWRRLVAPFPPIHNVYRSFSSLVFMIATTSLPWAFIKAVVCSLSRLAGLITRLAPRRINFEKCLM